MPDGMSLFQQEPLHSLGLILICFAPKGKKAKFHINFTKKQCVVL